MIVETFDLLLMSAVGKRNLTLVAMLSAIVLVVGLLDAVRRAKKHEQPVEKMAAAAVTCLGAMFFVAVLGGAVLLWGGVRAFAGPTDNDAAELFRDVVSVTEACGEPIREARVRVENDLYVSNALHWAALTVAYECLTDSAGAVADLEERQEVAGRIEQFERSLGHLGVRRGP